MRTLCLILLLLFLLPQPPLFSAERILVDMAGRQVEIPTNVGRIITTYRSATEFIFALRAQDRLVAVEMDTHRIPLFQSLLPHIGELPVVGSRRKGINLETVVALAPDLVILFPYQEGIEMAKRLKEQGIASIIIDPESFEKIRECSLMLGEALGLNERAEEVDGVFEEILTLVEKAREIPHQEKKTVYFANQSLLDTMGKGMMQDSLIEMAGGIHVAGGEKSGFLRISMEQLIAWNPQYIILSQFYPGEIQELLDLPFLQSVEAIKNKEVHRLPSNIYPWDFPGPSSFLSIIWLKQILYPHLHRPDVLDEVLEHFYSILFGRSFVDLGGRLP